MAVRAAGGGYDSRNHRHTTSHSTAVTPNAIYQSEVSRSARPIITRRQWGFTGQARVGSGPASGPPHGHCDNVGVCSDKYTHASVLTSALATVGLGCPFVCAYWAFFVTLVRFVWAPADMGRGDLPPGNVEKCFFAANVVWNLSRRSIYASFWENVVCFWRLRPHTPHRGAAPGPCWATSVLQTPSLPTPWKYSAGDHGQICLNWSFLCFYICVVNNVHLRLRDPELTRLEFRLLLKTHLFRWGQRRLVTFWSSYKSTLTLNYIISWCSQLPGNATVMCQ